MLDLEDAAGMGGGSGSVKGKARGQGEGGRQWLVAGCGLAVGHGAHHHRLLGSDSTKAREGRLTHRPHPRARPPGPLSPPSSNAAPSGNLNPASDSATRRGASGGCCQPATLACTAAAQFAQRDRLGIIGAADGMSTEDRARAAEQNDQARSLLRRQHGSESATP